eukprot:326125_1
MEYSLVITILYASIYCVVFIITSIICAVKVKAIRNNRKNESNTFLQQHESKPNSNEQAEIVQNETNDDQKDSNPFRSIVGIRIDSSINEAKEQNNKQIKTEDTKNENDDIDIKIKHKTKDKWYTPIKEWFHLLSEKRKVYLSLIPHIFDQATDYGVVYTYYSIWQEHEDSEMGDANPKYFFYASLFVIIFHRAISSVAIYRLTQSWKDVILQSFDILMVKAIWLNYKLDKKEPVNPQRYLQILEAALESAPQILISSGYILKSSTDKNAQPISSLIIISALFSLWSLVSRVAADDRIMFNKYSETWETHRWKDIEFRYDECPCINIRYLFRVLIWRFFEITNRIFVCLLIWINLGGLALSIIICFEFIYCLIVCIYTKSVDPIAQLMYLSFGGDGWKSDFSNTEWLLTFFWYYRVLSFYIYMILITMFATINLETSEVEEFSTRNGITIKNKIGLFMLIYSWITGCIWPWAGFLTKRSSNAGVVSNIRDLRTLVEKEQFGDVVELMEFGVTLTKKDCQPMGEFDYTLLHHISHIRGTNIDVNALAVMQKVVTLDSSLINKKNELYILELECKNGGSLIHLAVAMSLINRDICRDSSKVLQSIIRDDNININSRDNENNTALHYIAKNNTLDDTDRENMKILLNHGIDVKVKNSDGKTAYDLLNERTSLNEHYVKNYNEMLKNIQGCLQ